ncbi:hypothetical protein DXG01_004509 [Tephrocybe rancida]|nr:hypothetical protein DXG01_004509 [Tephrocybe rancida]
MYVLFTAIMLFLWAQHRWLQVPPLPRQPDPVGVDAGLLPPAEATIPNDLAPLEFSTPSTPEENAVVVYPILVIVVSLSVPEADRSTIEPSNAGRGSDGRRTEGVACTPEVVQAIVAAERVVIFEAIDRAHTLYIRYTVGAVFLTAVLSASTVWFITTMRASSNSNAIITEAERDPPSVEPHDVVHLDTAPPADAEDRPREVDPESGLSGIAMGKRRQQGPPAHNAASGFMLDASPSSTALLELSSDTLESKAGHSTRIPHLEAIRDSEVDVHQVVTSESSPVPQMDATPMPSPTKTRAVDPVTGVSLVVIGKRRQRDPPSDDVVSDSTAVASPRSSALQEPSSDTPYSEAGPSTRVPLSEAIGELEVDMHHVLSSEGSPVPQMDATDSEACPSGRVPSSQAICGLLDMYEAVHDPPQSTSSEHRPALPRAQTPRPSHCPPSASSSGSRALSLETECAELQSSGVDPPDSVSLVTNRAASLSPRDEATVSIATAQQHREEAEAWARELLSRQGQVVSTSNRQLALWLMENVCRCDR